MNDPQARGLESQLAIFWLQRPVEVRTEEAIYDLEALLGSPMGDGGAREGPPPEISQLQSLLALPWTGSDRALNVADNGFYLAVLSANKGRLVVREWFSIDLARLKENLEAFLGALRITNPWGTEATALPIPALLGALDLADPVLTRGLLRTAYLGHRPPRGLLESALRRFRIPKTLKNDKSLYRLAAVLKLVLTYGKEESKTLEKLNERRTAPAYLCGRLLSVLEEAQKRASGWSLSSTIVDRFYSAASAAPAANLTTLLNRAQSAHLPKIRKEKRGYGQMQGLLEEILTHLDEAGGFPQVLSPPKQGEFALGFYHQRASFRAHQGSQQASTQVVQERGV